jgi:hypothetical protein
VYGWPVPVVRSSAGCGAGFGFLIVVTLHIVALGVALCNVIGGGGCCVLGDGFGFGDDLGNVFLGHHVGQFRVGLVLGPVVLVLVDAGLLGLLAGVVLDRHPGVVLEPVPQFLAGVGADPAGDTLEQAERVDAGLDTLPVEQVAVAVGFGLNEHRVSDHLVPLGADSGAAVALALHLVAAGHLADYRVLRGLVAVAVLGEQFRVGGLAPAG